MGPREEITLPSVLYGILVPWNMSEILIGCHFKARFGLFLRQVEKLSLMVSKPGL
jgi:hypothetical protein